MHTERQKQRQREHHGRMPEREEESDAQRPAAVGHPLAGGVVDRRDVVRVERVAQAERVRGQPDPHPVDAGAAEAEVSWHDEQKRAEPNDMKCQDRDAKSGASLDLACGQHARAAATAA